MKKIGILLCIIISFIVGCIRETQTEEKQTQFMQEERMIRVLLCSDHFESRYHQKIVAFSKNGCVLKTGKGEIEYGPGQLVEIDQAGWPYGENIVLEIISNNGEFSLPELKRERSTGEYRGTLEVRNTPEGLVLINILPLEEYLCGVIPSEMPAGYPDEALKAQAICARTYSLRQIQNPRLNGFYADVDDSTAFQVYNNQERSEWTDLAVKNTKGMVLMQDGSVIEAMYYSTSCGLDLHINLSEEAVMTAFLLEDKVQSYETGEPMFRWKAELNMKLIKNLNEIEVTKRNNKGAAEELKVIKSGIQEAEYIEGEYEIRRFLAQMKPVLTLQDGTQKSCSELLPSAFFVIKKQDESGNCILIGGGSGHGIGMSQNGAKHMAMDGKNYEEILKNYYPEARLEHIYG